MSSLSSNTERQLSRELHAYIARVKYPLKAVVSGNGVCMGKVTYEFMEIENKGTGWGGGGEMQTPGLL